MLLRIEIPPPQLSSSSAAAASTPLVDNKGARNVAITTGSIFHACPATATASNHSDGTLLTVGRKNTDVTFASERSVSRSHCNLRLISLDSAAGTGNGNGNGAVGPSGEDEIEACESSADGMAIVLEDLNSKFGTFFYVDKDKDGIEREKRKADDSETDETDDEGVGMSMSAAPALSQLSSSSAMMPEWIHNKIRKRVQNKVILKSLCLPKDEDEDNNNNNNNNNNTARKSSLSTTIQCGNAILNVTRITLNICHSQLRSADSRRIRQASTTIGATITSTIDGPTTTYLVSPTRISTAKSICAWMYQIPVVSMSFVDALAERTSVADDMPRVEDHKPPGKLPMDTLDLVDDDPTLPQRCLKGYKVLSLEDSDGEMLCRGAGATVVKLYADPKENGQVGNSFWKEDGWWEKLEDEQKQDRLVIVWLTCAKNKQKRAQSYLTNVMKKHQSLRDDGDETQFRISSTSQTKVAKAITSLTVLEDVGGAELHTNLPSSPPKIHDVEMEVDLSSTKKEDEHHNGDDTDSNDDDNAIQMSYSDTGKKNQAIQETHTSSQHPATSQKVPPSQQSGTAGWMISSQMEHRGNKSLIEEDIVAPMEEEEEANISYQESEYPIPERAPNKKSRKNKLKVTADGWLVAAPQGRKRARYRRPADELASYGEAPLSDPAQTEHCNSLIIMRTKEDARHPITTANRTNDHHNRNVKDFKRFQKNSVITGARMHSLSQIRLRAVLPKESERQRQLVESQQELELEQRAADSLFAVCEDNSRRGKSNLRNYFQATAKRGNGRRRRA